MATQTKRRRHAYRGVSPAERDATRRRALLDAALELFGTRGWIESPVTALCTQAGVTTRNFYELYNGREQLFLAAYDEVTTEGITQIREVAAQEPDPARRLEAGLRAAVGYYADRRRARIVFVEIFGRGPEPEQHRHDAIARSADMAEGVLEALVNQDGSAIPLRACAIALVGAFSELMVSRAATGAPGDEEIVATLAHLFGFGLRSAEG